MINKMPKSLHILVTTHKPSISNRWLIIWNWPELLKRRSIYALQPFGRLWTTCCPLLLWKILKPFNTTGEKQILNRFQTYFGFVPNVSSKMTRNIFLLSHFKLSTCSCQQCLWHSQNSILEIGFFLIGLFDCLECSNEHSLNISRSV